jgi:hypothetical protein
MKTKFYSIFWFLFICFITFVIMYFIQNHNNTLCIKELDELVEKEIIELQKN